VHAELCAAVTPTRLEDAKAPSCPTPITLQTEGESVVGVSVCALEPYYGPGQSLVNLGWV
jgi:hypothetical protein